MIASIMPEALHPAPIIEIAIEPKSKTDEEKLGAALAELDAEDPSFQVSTDHESGQTILKGTSESHLEGKVDRIRRTYRIDARVGAPQVAFRERPTERVEHAFTHKRQWRGKGQFAVVRLVVEPNEPGKGYAFESGIAEGALPRTYMSGVKEGIESVLTSGIVAGFPVVDVKVLLVDAKHHDQDSSAAAFESAARACFREALQKAKSVLLEPIMKVEVVTPEECARSVTGDLRRRRGRIDRQDRRGASAILNAIVPLMNMFGYADDLRVMSEGRATFTMQFDQYAVAPPNDDGNGAPFRPAIGMRA
jgi:elongation factor G